VTIRILDMEGGYTDYKIKAHIASVAPVATLGPSGGASMISSGAPILFTDIIDPSHQDNLEGFRYFWSVDGEPFTETGEPKFTLPSYANNETVHVRGYLRDADDADSPIYECWVTTVATQRFFVNRSSGVVELSWENDGGVVLQPYEYYAGVGTEVVATLLTAGATYRLSSNADIQQVKAGSGVTSVYLEVRTDVIDLIGVTRSPFSPIETNGPYFIGEGHIGAIEPPQGTQANKTIVNVFSRGDLESVIGPQLQQLAWLDVQNLEFTNLKGSITEVDFINNLHARGDLGDGEGDDVISANIGIDVLRAAAVNARVIADRFFDHSDVALDAFLGHGTTKQLIADEIGGIQSRGDLGDVRTNLFQTLIEMIGPTNIKHLFIDNRSEATQIKADGTGQIGTMILGEEAAERSGHMDYYPVGLGQVVGGFQDDFWATLDPKWRLSSSPIGPRARSGTSITQSSKGDCTRS
jgi:hypothetical protein